MRTEVAGSFGALDASNTPAFASPVLRVVPRPRPLPLVEHATTEQQRLTYIVKITTGCNLACSYCIAEPYLDRQAARVLDAEMLARLVRATAGGQGAVQLILHGGEPLLPGKKYWRELLSRIEGAAGGAPLLLYMQTNGTLLDREWVGILKQHGVTVGLSIDGPRDMHDRHRPRVGGRGSFDAVVRASALLAEGGIEPHALCVITPALIERFPHGGEFVEFLLALGIRAFDLKPLLDPDFDYIAYARWMCTTFDAWVARDDLGIRIRTLGDVVLRALGRRAQTCTASGACSTYLTVMPNGDVHGCDRWVTPDATPIARLTPSNVDEVYEDLRRTRCGCTTVCPRCWSACPYEHSLWDTKLCQGQEILRAHISDWIDALAYDWYERALARRLGSGGPRLSDWIASEWLLSPRRSDRGDRLTIAG